MTTYTDHQQRLLDQGASPERVADAAGRVGYERQGTAYDPGAVGHEAVGRDKAPARTALADEVLASKGQIASRIGSGIIVARRNSKGRLTAAHKPLEHVNREAAETEAARLANANPGVVFEVLMSVEVYLCDKVTPVHKHTYVEGVCSCGETVI